MSNKTFIIAFVISLFFHFWIISVPFSFNMTEDYPGKEQPSTRMIFFTPDSLSLPAGEKVKPFSFEHKKISEKVIEENPVSTQKKDLITEVVEEKDKKKDVPVLVTEKTTEQPQISKREKIEEIREKIVQEKETISLSQKEDVQVDLSTIKTEKEEDKSRDIYLTAESEIKPAQTAPGEGEQQTVFLPSSDSAKYQIKENNLSKRAETPLDLTQSDFSDNQIVFPKIIFSQQLEYPGLLRKRKIEGHLLLKVLINKEGKVVQMEIDHSSGYKAFDQAAVESVYQWKFKPAQIDNKKKDSWVLIPVRFQLE